MAEIINFKQAQKQRDRMEKAKRAKTNRANSGQTKAERLKAEIEKAKSKIILDAHKIDDD